MSHIFKYSLPAQHGSVSELSIPAKAVVLSVQAQGTVLCLWAAFDEVKPSKSKTAKPQVRKFVTCYTGAGTGPKLSDIKAYIGTVQLNSLVYHVFELKK